MATAGRRPVWVVGGVLRDRLLGLATADLDVVVDGHGEELARRLAAALPGRLVHLGGKEFAAYRLVAGDGVVDLWDRSGMSAEADLLRRDFTIDAMAWEPRSDAWLDPAGGLADLRRRRLRATLPGAFLDDPLRVLRLVRLALTLPGFVCVPRTTAFAVAALPALAGVAAERVREELSRILRQPGAVGTRLVATGLYPALWLTFSPPSRAAAGGAARRLVRRFAALDRRLAELAARRRLRLRPEELALARQALAFSSLTLAPQERTRALARFTAAGYLSRRESEQLSLALTPGALPTRPADQRLFLHRHGRHWPVVAARLGAEASAPSGLTAWRRTVAALAALGRREGRRLFAPPRLLGGEEVQRALALPPGPAIGRVLTDLVREQVTGRVRTRRQALAWLADRAAGGARGAAAN